MKTKSQTSHARLMAAVKPLLEERQTLRTEGMKLRRQLVTLTEKGQRVAAELADVTRRAVKARVATTKLFDGAEAAARKEVEAAATALLGGFADAPAAVVKDAASLSIVNSSDRKKVEEQLVAKMAEIDKRLNDLAAQSPKR